MILSYSFPVSLIGTVMVGCMFAHAVELQHQCIHDAAFKVKFLNRVAGIILGTPMLVSFWHYRLLHLGHHRLLGTPLDRGFFKYEDSRQLSVTNLSKNIFSLSRYLEVTKAFASLIKVNAFAEIIDTRDSTRIRLNYLFLVFVVLSAITFSIYFRSTLLVFTWWIPAILIAEPVHFLFELPEHYKCANDKRDPIANTRTILGSPFSNWLTNGNNFHVEHHLYPNLPNDQLGAVHTLVRPRLQNFCKSYPEFFRLVASDLWHVAPKKEK